VKAPWQFLRGVVQGSAEAPGRVAAAFNRWSERTPTQRLWGVRATGRARVASAAGPAEDQSAAFLILPWTAAGKRVFRSELPAAFFEHSEQRNALHPKARAHVRDSWLLRTPLARSAVTTVRPCTRA